ncbi:hypothetical protein E3P92_01211 [Wallemia ichthyophaga]|nr:hypothetical protein E3P98_01123 [Wallemia ichthyophaga]TIB16763.1 hypothetical protein E3P92_01211 [Wallemia ichthyophaga]TIB36424.1 hypothetical protein E3P84_00961 [Wallemia ichthyophaga]TIB42766.1 hypothetical protein E3P83_01006 [Wallemia ichthyophaga]
MRNVSGVLANDARNFDKSDGKKDGYVDHNKLHRKDDVDDGADGGNKARPVPQKQQTDSKKGGNDDAKMR